MKTVEAQMGKALKLLRCKLADYFKYMDMEDLLIKYVMGEATREEMAQVERWLEADAANRRLYEEYKTVWLLSRQTAMRESAEPADTGEAWQRFRSMAITRSGGGIVREKRIRLGGRGWMRVAAMVAGTLILGAGGYLLLMNHRPDREDYAGHAQMVAKRTSGRR